MIRAIGIVLAGSVIGAAASLLIVGEDPEPVSADEARVAVSGQLLAYRTAAAIDDTDALEAVLRDVAAEPVSAARELDIDAYLIRLAALDPPGAVNLALSLGLDERFVVAALHSWARTDVDAALRALAGLDDSGLRRTAALGLVDVVGGETAGVDRIAAALPETDHTAFLVSALVWRAEVEPERAFRDALDLREPAARRQAALRIANVWVRRDPVAAMRAADVLPDALQSEYVAHVSEAWARVDPGGYLAYLEAYPEQREFTRAVLWLAGSDPARSLQVAAMFPGEFSDSLRTIAESVLVERDPDAALAYTETLRPGSERDQLMRQVAARYGSEDPDAALRWLESQPELSPDVQAAVYSSIIKTDPARAAELIEQLPAGVDARRFLSIYVSASPQDQERIVTLADSLIASSDPRARTMLSDLAFGWVQQTPDRALDWIETNGAELDALFLGNAARGLARSAPSRAASFVDRLPPGARGEWMTVVAEPYARSNPRDALSWIARYSGQAGYDAALRQVVTRAAQSDPQSAAALLAQANAETQVSAAPEVASTWASRDPAAAAQWSQSLSDARARSSALTAVISTWTTRDLDAAARWTRNMPRGEARDEALAIVLSREAYIEAAESTR